MDLLLFDGYLRIVAPVFVAWLAWIAWRTPYQERANRILALFLVMIAVGYAAEVLWILSRRTTIDLELLRSVQVVVGVIDPPLLLMFALAFRPPLPSVTRFLLGAAYATMALALIVAQVPRQDLDDPLFATLHFLYVNGTYLIAFALLALSYVGESRPYLARQLGFLTIGVGFATLSRAQALHFTGGPDWAYIADPILRVFASALQAGILLALVTAWTGGAPKVRHRSALPLMRVVALLLVGFYALTLLFAFAASNVDRLSGLTALFFPLRWVVFSLVVGYGMLRFQLFDFDLRVRQAGALLVAAVLSVILAMLSGAAVHDRGAELVVARALGLAVAFGAAVPLYLVAARTIGALAPTSDTPAGFHRRRLEIYQATLEYALAKPLWSDDERRFVETLREVFEVTPEEHARLVGRLRAAQGSPEG